MSEAVYQEALGSFTERQLAVLRISIMAERRLRTHYQRDPSDEPSLRAAYAWAKARVS